MILESKSETNHVIHFALAQENIEFKGFKMQYLYFRAEWQMQQKRENNGGQFANSVYLEMTVKMV